MRSSCLTASSTLRTTYGQTLSISCVALVSTIADKHLHVTKRLQRSQRCPVPPHNQQPLRGKLQDSIFTITPSPCHRGAGCQGTPTIRTSKLPSAISDCAICTVGVEETSWTDKSGILHHHHRTTYKQSVYINFSPVRLSWPNFLLWNVRKYVVIKGSRKWPR